MKPFLALVLAVLTTASFAATPREAYDLARAGKAVIVDVREPPELKAGMVKGARSFPLSRLTGDGWKADFTALAEERKVFLYCRTGNRSGKAREILRKNGIESHNLGGYEELRTVLPSETP
jgi:phage shock protein E